MFEKIALDLADKDMQNVKGIISDAPNVSIKDFFENEFAVKVEDFECVDIVSNSQYPILLSAGSNEKMEELFDKIKSANPNTTEIIILPGCDHGNRMYKQTELYQRAIREFIDKVIEG